MNQRSINANADQHEASNPMRSSFVSANAGSGKTSVLTQRIARLLLKGVRPESILCLTYTKAAAGEIQNRVFGYLAEWVLLEDDALIEKLGAAGEQGELSSEILVSARRLFAQALETPGGLKIQTIHAFASSILRRFPLEAGVSPNFTELGELEKEQIFRRAVENTVTDNLEKARYWRTLFALDNEGILENITRFTRKYTPYELAREHDLQQPVDVAEICDEVHSKLSNVANADRVKALGSTSEKYWISLQSHVKEGEHIRALEDIIAMSHTQSGSINAALLKRANGTTKVTNEVMDLCNWLIDVGVTCQHTRFCQINAELYNYGFELRLEFERLKSKSFALDYDDLIDRCQKLLNSNDRMNWVMFKLDGGIEHILVDEAQDTNDAQWRIIDALAQQLPSALDRDRSLFVVGDEKQSIFAFQGANPDIFLAKRDEYEAYFKQNSRPFYIGSMSTSFRSSQIILNFVDEVFKDDLAEGLGDEIAHIALHDDTPGSVEVWPFYEIESDKEKSNESWSEVEITAEENVKIKLARDIATMIETELAQGKQILSKDGWRSVEPGDYLILTRKRDDVYRFVQNELQKRGVPIAGVDKMKLNTELPVMDIMALLRYVVSPFDNFSLACFLRSPIVGLSEQALFELCADKKMPLISALKKQSEKYGEVIEMIASVRELAQSQRPFDIISAFLIKYDVEGRLRSRLGLAVTDAVASLLDQAIAYEQAEPPTLTGFITWFDRQEIQVKRELEETSDAVRVMTIHGAKGLEAPIVIVPLVDSRDPSGSSIKNIYGKVLMAQNSVLRPPVITEKLEAIANKQFAEERRLLYVALTRAKSRLIMICGGKLGEDKKNARNKPSHFYGYLCNALDQTEGEYSEVDFGESVIRMKSWKTISSAGVPYMEGKTPVKLAILPFDKLDSVRPEAGLSQNLPAYESKQKQNALGAEYGTMVHDMIENWPKIGEASFINLQERAHYALAFEEARAVIQKYPELLEDRTLFETEMNIEPIDGLKLEGRIDAICFENEKIRIIDFKSERKPVKVFADLPQRYQMQLAVYWACVKDLALQKSVSAEIIWTVDQTALIATDSELEGAYLRLQTFLSN